MKHSFKNFLFLVLLFSAGNILFTGCKPKGSGSAVASDAASKVYVAPGKYDEFYDFVSGGFSGQMAVYGIPSGRLLRVIPVFSVDPEKGYGYSEETKPMLNTSNGFIPWMIFTISPFLKLMAYMMDAGFLPMEIIHPVLQGSTCGHSAPQRSWRYRIVRVTTPPLSLLKILNI